MLKKAGKDAIVSFLWLTSRYCVSEGRTAAHRRWFPECELSECSVEAAAGDKHGSLRSVR